MTSEGSSREQCHIQSVTARHSCAPFPPGQQLWLNRKRHWCHWQHQGPCVSRGWQRGKQAGRKMGLGNAPGWSSSGLVWAPLGILLHSCLIPARGIFKVFAHVLPVLPSRRPGSWKRGHRDQVNSRQLLNPMQGFDAIKSDIWATIGLKEPCVFTKKMEFQE